MSVVIDVLYEDNHVLAVNKPAMLPTMGVAAGKPNLLDDAKRYIKEKYDKPGNVYLGIVSRLDAPVTGVVLIARTSKAASRLSEQFRNRDVDKTYWALVAKPLHPQAGELVHWLRKDERHRKMHVVEDEEVHAQEARLAYRHLKQVRSNHLYEIDLHTGRKHQIRVQLSARRCPILGDRKYGAKQPFPFGIALHSRKVSFEHPVKKSTIELVAPLPDSWRKLGAGE